MSVTVSRSICSLCRFSLSTTSAFASKAKAARRQKTESTVLENMATDSESTEYAGRTRGMGDMQ